ncbi:hypothetical protein M378DRAFT_17768 [Amanita muscaria Koide BX008]|uniref:Uncharacterized protein n=1 Tax=Amanita muscaria (strain Koide BX008) TaxID=946122 RepID=A0A0C2WHP4_AMAMK|nr:hypothetical protein M378DRAFT_17768 [Amanita muscaria Koide BX008]
MVRANKEQPGDIKFPYGGQVREVLPGSNQPTLVVPRTSSQMEEPRVGGSAYRFAFGTETTYNCWACATRGQRSEDNCAVEEVFDLFYAPPPEVVVTPVDPVGVNGNPQPPVDANPDGNIVNVVDEAGVAETTAVNGGQVLDHGRRSAPATAATTTSATASRAAGATKAARAHEDFERLRKAQAIHTFAEVGHLGPPDEVSTYDSAEAQAPRRAPEEQREAKREGRRGATAAATKRTLSSWEEGDVEEIEGALDGQHDIDELDLIGPVPVPSQLRGRRETTKTSSSSSCSASARGRAIECQNRPVLAQSRIPVSPSEPIFHHQRLPTPWHTMANGIDSTTTADHSNPVFTPSAAPPQPPTPAPRISMSDSRASRNNQVFFLLLRFRQRQGHRVASSLSGGERAVASPTPRKQTGQFLLNPVSPSEQSFTTSGRQHMVIFQQQ